jgi:DNA modification methylase
MENNTKIEKRPRKPKEEENKPGRYDPRNKLNDLTGKQWLLCTKSFWETEPCKEDKAAYKHPAPFLIKDVQKLIGMFTKKGMTVLDPFVGSGTSIIAANQIERYCIGIDLNPDYQILAQQRLSDLDLNNYEYIVGDSREIINNIEDVDYIITSPPYHNILKNKTTGIRKNNGKNYRIGARDGVEYYSDHENDLGNFEEYNDFINAFKEIMSIGFSKLKNGKYCTIVISDFTVNKKEVFVQGDMVNLMQEIGYEFQGTTVLLQPVKPLFPFGYPYAYKSNRAFGSGNFT